MLGFVERPIFRLLKTAELTPGHFERHLGGCYLTEAGRKVFAAHWDGRLRQTVQHRTLNKKVSYERLIRLECYKLVRHLCDPAADPYEGFPIMEMYFAILVVIALVWLMWLPIRLLAHFSASCGNQPNIAALAQLVKL